MEIYVAGLASGYELEHVARLFWPGATLAKRWPARKDAVVARASSRRLLCGVRLGEKTAVRCAAVDGQQDVEYALAAMLFGLLCHTTQRRPAWGMLTGVRPVRLVHDHRARGESESDIADFFKNRYFVSDEKYQLAVTIANNQQNVLSLNTPRSYSLYVSIPFCPSRCSYCSFVSRTTAQSAQLIAPYLEKLQLELADISAAAQRNRLRLETVYIGGGTPTSLTAAQLRALMETLASLFDMNAVREYTVEAGRPDCTTPEKLDVIKAGGATRISINPQTMSDEVLAAIGRKHTAQDIVDCFKAARSAGHNNINMDLIAGLPRDTPQGFARSVREVLSLGPENITVHTLTRKRASNLVIDALDGATGDVSAMVETAARLLSKAYEPYYLYRQKGTLENLENVGYAKPGFIGLYNVFIMEEVHTILAAGAGGSTKFVPPCGKGKITRSFNFKYPLEYVRDFDTVRRRKTGVDDFYGQFTDLDSQAAR